MKKCYAVQGVVSIEVDANTPEEAAKIARNKAAMLEDRHSYLVVSLEDDEVLEMVPREK